MTPLTGPEQVDDALIRDASLHLRRDNELTRIRDSYSNKIERVQSDYDDHQDSRFLQGLEYTIEQQHPELTPTEVTEEVASEVAFYTAKHDRLVELTRLCNVELMFRTVGKVDRKADIEAVQ